MLPVPALPVADSFSNDSGAGEAACGFRMQKRKVRWKVSSCCCLVCEEADGLYGVLRYGACWRDADTAWQCNHYCWSGNCGWRFRLESVAMRSSRQRGTQDGGLTD